MLADPGLAETAIAHTHEHQQEQQEDYGACWDGDGQH